MFIDTLLISKQIQLINFQTFAPDLVFLANTIVHISSFWIEKMIIKREINSEDNIGWHIFPEWVRDIDLIHSRIAVLRALFVYVGIIIWHIEWFTLRVSDSHFHQSKELNQQLKSSCENLTCHRSLHKVEGIIWFACTKVFHSNQSILKR